MSELPHYGAFSYVRDASGWDAMAEAAQAMLASS